MSILSSVHDALSSVFEAVWDDAVYTAIRSGGAQNDFDEPTETKTVYGGVKAQIDDSRSGVRADGDIRTATRYVLILVDSLPITPQSQDSITITPVGGVPETLRLGELVGRDPANVAYKVRVET